MSETREGHMTHTQRAVWTLERLDSSLNVFCCAYAATADAPLDPALLEEAVRGVLRRHESTRTSFPASGGRPTSRIHASMEVPIAWRCAGRDTDAQLIDRMAADARRRHDLEREPPFRISVYVRATGENVVLIEGHHIMGDWLTIRMMMEEVEKRYTALKADDPDIIPPLACQFSDHAKWQNDMLAGEAGQRHEAYWRERLSGEAPDLSIPTDRPRPRVESHIGSSHLFEVPGELLARLTDAARQADVTLYSVLLASFATLLHRYSGAPVVTLGSHTSGRVRRALDPILGLVSNPIPIRVAFPPGFSFAQLAREVARSVRGALRHQFYPPALMAERIERSRNPGRSPLFQAVFILTRDEPLLLESPAWRHEPWIKLGLRNQEGQFELKLVTDIRRDGSLMAALQFQTAIYDEATAVRLARAWVTLLEDAAQNPSREVAALRLLDTEEERKVLRTWNDTTRDDPGEVGVQALVRAQCQRTPAALAVSDEKGSITYGELARRVGCLASNLRRAGVGSGSIVGVCLPPSIDQVVTLLAVLETGAAYLPLDPAHPRERRNVMLGDAHAALLIGDARTVEGLSAGRVLLIDQLAQAPELGSHLPELIDKGGDSLAYVLFTSGSTGRPKGVEITQRSLVNLLTAMQDLLEIGPSDTWLSITTLSFDIAALEIFLPLISGAHVVMANRDVAGSGPRLAEAIERHAITVMQATPTSWRLLQAARRSTRPLKRLCGGEPLTRSLADQLLRDPGPVWNLYGPTETTIWSTASRVVAGDRKPPIGRPLANTQVYVLDARMQPVPVGVTGDLWISGAGVARGYVGLPELTAERFRPDPFSTRPGARLYRTGDIARWLASGELEFAGRDDYQVKIRGIRIELGEIEAALLAQPDISEAVVSALEQPDAETRLIGYLVPKPGRSLNLSLVRTTLRRRLPDYMVPSTLTVLEAMPLTPNGKVDRRSLPHSEVGPAPRTPFVPPRTRLEAELAGLVADVLRLRRVGIDDDFFDLGGASLASLDFSLRAEQAGVNIAPELIFEHRTVRALAAALQGPTPREAEHQDAAPVELQ